MKTTQREKRCQDIDIMRNVPAKLHAVPLDACDDHYVQLLEGCKTRVTNTGDAFEGK